MFKAARWRSEKNKAKAVFKLRFQATQVPPSGSQPLVVVLVPADDGRPTVRTEKSAAAADGTCSWVNPVYESVKLVRDPATAKMDARVYTFKLTPSGSRKGGALGEASVNLADYAEAYEANSISLPLRASSTGTILNITIQRMEVGSKGREGDEVGEAMIKLRRRMLPGHLNKWEIGEIIRRASGINSIKIIRDGSRVNSQLISKSPSCRDIPIHGDFDGSLQKSYSFDVISVSDSDASSGIYAPIDNGIKNHIAERFPSSFLAPPTNSGNPKRLVHSSGDWSGSSAPSGYAEALRSSSGKMDVSDLELQNLQKQITKETSRAQDLLRELSSLKEERDALRRECEELKLFEKRVMIDGKLSTRLLHDGDDRFSLEEIKQELDHERNLNVHLRLQLKMMQQSNSELILPLKGLDKPFEQKNKEIICTKCDKIDLEMETGKLGNGLPLPQKPDCSNEEQYALSASIDEYNDTKTNLSVQNRTVDSDTGDEMEFYRKDYEDLEMQMEQLALDYEILKQEKHDIDTKFQQMQLREQLRTQYECASHVAVINDLESRVECLEKELQKQAEAFESDVEILTRSKVEQEKRAIMAEEALRNTKWNIDNIVERLQEELGCLSSQMTLALKENEKMIKQVVKQAAELQLQKSIVEKILEKTKRDLVSVQDQYRIRFKQLADLLNFKSKEIDRLLLDIKDKEREVENYKMAEEARQKDSEEMHLLQAEVGRLKSERSVLSENIEEKEKLLLDMQLLRTSIKQCEMSLQDKHLEIDLLKKEISVLRDENQSLKERNGVWHQDDAKDTMITELKSEADNFGLQCSEFEACIV